MNTTIPPFTNRRYLDAIDDHIVIFDGAMGTSIQNYDLSPADYGGEQYQDCLDYLVISRPDIIRENSRIISARRQRSCRNQYLPKQSLDLV